MKAEGGLGKEGSVGLGRGFCGELLWALITAGETG